MVDWFKGPLVPYRELDDIEEDFAPHWVKLRLDSGEWGGFNLELECKKAGLPPLKEVREEDLWKRVLEYMPALRYRAFDKAWQSKEGLLARMDKNLLMRQAHTCLRIELVIATPKKEQNSKLTKRGGVTINCRCTVCGESTQVCAELSAKHFKTSTGLKIKGVDLSRFGS